MDWVPLNLADTRQALQRWTTMEQRGQWICGYHQGASGALLMGGEPDAFADGFAHGSKAHADSSEHRAKVSQARSDAAKKRWNRGSDASAHPNADANAYGIEDAKPIHKTRQDRTEQTEQQLPPQSPQVGRRPSAPMFVPPTEQEWVAYCTATWPDWHPTCAAEGWAYYQSVGWKMRAGPIRDWKAAAKTQHGNAVSWGKLKPMPGGSPNFGRRPGPATGRAAVDQALINQLEEQQHGTEQPLPQFRDTTGELGW